MDIKAYFTSSTSSTIVFFLMRYAVGAATKMDDSVPNTTPKIIAKAKLRMLAPPKQKITANTMNVETEVLMVRFNVLFSEVLKSS